MTNPMLQMPKHQTILIVDDTPTNLGVIVESLEKIGFRVIIAQDGEEAIQRTIFVKPDLILLDVMMPGINGFEVCRQLKNNPEFGEIPIIFMTSLSETEHKVAGFKAGAVDYVTKPLRIEEVIARINTHLKISWMQRQLLESNEQLLNSKTALELQIKERTHELQESNQQLRNEIIERQQAQEQLTLIDFALNHVIEAVFLLDELTYIVYVNTMACVSLGYSSDELLQMTVHDFDFDYPAERCRELWRTLKIEQTLTFETIHCKKNGHSFPVEVVCNYFEFKDKAYNLCLVRNITERKKTEAILHKREQEFRSLIEHSPDIIARFDRAGRYTYANPALLAAENLSQTELLGKQPTEILYDFERATGVELMVQTVLNTGVATAYEVAINIQGSTFPYYYDFRILPEQSQNDSISSVLTIGRDITKLKETERQMRLLAENSPDIIARFDQDGRYIYVNSTIEKFLGIPKKKFIGREFGETSLEYAMIQDQHSLLSVRETIKQAIQSGNEIQVDFIWWVRKKKHIFEFRLIPEFDTNGIVKSLLGFARDISARKIAEDEQRLASSVFSSALEGIMVTNPKGKLLYVNQAFCRITGYTQEEVLGHSPRILRSGLHEDTFYTSMWETITTRGYWKGDIWNKRKSGEIYPQRLTISTVFNGHHEITNYVGIFTDISVLKQQEKQLETMAYYDALTGIPNRVLLNERMKEAIVQTDKLTGLMAVVYLDLDGFKPINDTYGHAMGDQLLIEVARRITQELRTGDTLARLGGDEFVVLLVGLKQREDCEQMLRRLLETLSAPMIFEDLSIIISASIGVSLYPSDRVDADTLLRHADQSMYRAKQSGKNCFYIHDPEQDRINFAYRENQKRISDALLQDEFVLYYQPKIDLRTREVIGAEALIRWQKPGNGLIPPNDFLPLIEHTDIAITLDNWVVETALKQMTEWQRQGLTLPVSVNLSARSVALSGFTDSLASLLQKYPTVNPQHFELEILENEALQDLSLSSKVMINCQKLGVKFALDDFGTGYSSLRYLKYLPAQTLKIDQTFIRDMLIDEEDLAIVQGVIGLAQAFNRSVIAEGVESMQHGEQLVKIGCFLAQGFGIAKPMQGSLIADWILKWRNGNVS